MKFRIGETVRYVGEDFVTYKYGHLYKITGYDKDNDLYAVYSDGAEESYLLGEDVLEKVGGKR